MLYIFVGLNAPPRLTNQLIIGIFYIIIGMDQAWIFYLMTLNSVVNPWIYMIFNSNLVESLERLFCPSCYDSRHNAHPAGKKALRRSLLGGFKAQNMEVYETQRPSVSPR